MTETLELAMEKAATLPKEAQERIGLDVLEYIAAREALLADIDIGIRQIEAGLSGPLDFADVIRRGKERLAKRA